MDKNINIINSKDNILELNIEIEGIKPKETKCFFVIKTKEVNFSFECKYSENNIWLVTIPRMPQIEDTLYNFYIYMTVDGYYFEPYNGTINVMKSNDIYVKDISNKTFESTISNTETFESEIKKKELFSDENEYTSNKKSTSINKKLMDTDQKDKLIKSIIKDSIKPELFTSVRLKRGKVLEI